MLMRFCYSVLGPVKFLSHLDLLKLFSKSVVRAEIPLAYSEGFNPHPKISFGPPRGVAIAGLKEYGDMKLTKEMEPEVFIRVLNAALPKGFEILSARLIKEKTPPLMAAINLARYEILAQPIDVAELSKRIDELKAAKEVLAVRHNPKKGDKVVNLKEGILGLELEVLKPDAALLKLDLHFREGGTTKPSEVVNLLLSSPKNGVVTRTGLFIQTPGEGILEP